MSVALFQGSKMNKLAIIGFGSHVKKNILPAISRMKDLEVEFIYVRDASKYREEYKKYSFSFKNIDEHISSDISWVYIATPISTHYNLVKKYLDYEKNIICEKPLTNGIDKTKELFDIASSKGLKLFEVSMYQYHKQYHHLKKFIVENKPKVVKTSFTIPRLSKDDIRYNKELCGGALLDVGYYPVSILVGLFGKPKSINSKMFSEVEYDVDLFGSALFEYEYFYCIAEWGIGLPYANEITILSENKVAKYDRIFSKPETFDTKVSLKEGFNLNEIDIGKDDHFVNMFNQIMNHSQKSNEESTLKIIDILNIIKSSGYTCE